MAAGNYAELGLQAQLDMMTKELVVKDALTAKSTMWVNGQRELDEAGGSLESATNRVEPAWQSSDAKRFVQKLRLQVTTVKEWATNIQQANVPKVFGDLSQAITDAHAGVKANVDKWEQLVANSVAWSAQLATLYKRYQEANAAFMEGLDQQYYNSAQLLAKAVAGRPFGAPENTPAAGPPGLSPSPSGADPSATDQTAAEEAGGEQPTGGEQPAGGEQPPGGEAPGGPGGGGAMPGLDPGLAGGLGAAPTIPPPSLPPPLTIPPSMPGSGLPLVPLLPAAGLGGGGAGGGGGGGGARVPGVRLGGGGAPSSIASAAVPVSGPASATPAIAPVAPTGTGATAGGAPGGAIPPMIPPMGAGAMGAGSGGGPGNGAARRPGGPGRGRRDDSTPGLPAMLTGKAGKLDPHAFVARTRVAESDVPTTVQLIDEDLWQVQDQAPANDQVRRLSR